MNRTFFWLALMVATNFPSCSLADSSEFFPMSKGTYWIYRSTLLWQDGDTIRSGKVDWKMEVVDRIVRQDGVVAVLKGYPGDLAWFDPDRKPGDCLLVRIGETKLYLLHGDVFDNVLQRLMRSGEPLANFVDDSKLILQLPLKKGARFGEEDQMNRQDSMYVWTVQEERRFSAAGIKGISGKKRIEYSVVFSTNPDHIIATFVPGVGITSYFYAHHGTVAEADAKLVRFHSTSSSDAVVKSAVPGGHKSKH